MGDIGVPELLIILAVVMVVIGPGKLSGLGAALGRSIRELRQGLRDEKGEDAAKPCYHTDDQG
ncbi:twin-arginine translocase TatA/TatE family subunit [Oscillochloris sp. ZM17-4]|uniref:Sec-independent protein translocase subunit TatA/TatB n=1 Tax=Oscillochloris sp. ZM17-4 TaxID=2866714 RepID=UPI002107F443|nr:twin-arginine translocase TatA/TatE family subunit [Oscillochloris sp. ZM17-4]